MSFIQGLITWSQETFLPFGSAGLFAIAFIESSFFPIPPDLLLIPLALLNPELALFYAAVCTAGSVLGALLGYYIGLKGGRPVMKKLFGEKKTKSVEDYYRKYGDWAIAIAAFTPVPYKVFTIASGVFRHSIRNLIIISIVGRGARFFLVAGVIALWGEQILALLTNYFEIVTVGVTAVTIVVYLLYRKLKSRL